MADLGKKEFPLGIYLTRQKFNHYRKHQVSEIFSESEYVFNLPPASQNNVFRYFYETSPKRGLVDFKIALERDRVWW